MENWKAIPGWETYYAASTLGNIKRLAGSPRTSVDRVLKQRMTNFGYLTVSPVRAGISQRPLCVHILVLEAFAGPRPSPAHQGNHINGIKTDNRVENLEWVTRSENIKHSYDTNLHGRYIGSNASAAKITEADAAEILRRIANREYRKDIAKDYSISIKMIDEIVAGNHWTHVPRPDMSNKRMGRHKLVEADIPVIRQMLAEGQACRVIGERFGVSGPTIWQISAGRTWQHIC